MSAPGGGFTGAAPGGQPFQFDGEPYGLDPTTGAGLARPIGWRVHLPDGSGAWDKVGPGPTDWVPVGAGGAATDPFSIMAAHAQAYGKGLATPIDFSQFDPFVEDFPANTVSVNKLGGGSVTFDTVANNLGGFGRMKTAAGGATTNDFAFACCAGNVGYIGDVTGSSYYVEWKLRISGGVVLATTFHAVGLFQATANLNAGSLFVMVGLCGDGVHVPSKIGIAFWNGVDFIVTPSTTNADLSNTVDHYLGFGHDKVGHTFTIVLDGVAILTLSDATMAAHSGPGPYTYGSYDQASAAGFSNADKVFMVTDS